MDKELVIKAIKAYGLEPLTVDNAVSGYRNKSFAFLTSNSNKYNLILYKREPGMLAKIKNANYVSNYLAASGLPSRASADPRILKLAGNDHESYAALYIWLPGHTIPWEAYTMERLKQLGAAMGKMHNQLAKLGRARLPLAIDGLLELAGGIDRYFSEAGVKSALERKLGLKVGFDREYYAKIFNQLALVKNQHPLHLDFVRGNVLFAPGSPEATGILDFEKTAWGAPVLDLARTLAFLLVDCKFKQPDKVHKYFLISGYKKRGGGTLPRPELLNKLVEFFWLHDFYKFLRHNPYDFLYENEHFVRTLDFLLAADLVKR